MAAATGSRFGISTPPQQVSYADILRVWREADDIPEIEHAWLVDHLMPIAGDPSGPIFEGWTLLPALAAHTRRLRLGLLVTSNRFRPPAHLAKIAATVDHVSGGRLEFGIGPQEPIPIPLLPWSPRSGTPTLRRCPPRRTWRRCSPRSSRTTGRCSADWHSSCYPSTSATATPLSLERACPMRPSSRTPGLTGSSSCWHGSAARPSAPA